MPFSAFDQHLALSYDPCDCSVFMNSAVTVILICSIYPELGFYVKFTINQILESNVILMDTSILLSH